jgi:hypothetical protein
MKCDGFALMQQRNFLAEITDKNVAVLKRFCDYCKSIKSDCYNVAEVWTASPYTQNIMIGNRQCFWVHFSSRGLAKSLKP